MSLDMLYSAVIFIVPTASLLCLFILFCFLIVFVLKRIFFSSDRFPKIFVAVRNLAGHKPTENPKDATSLL